MISLNNLIFLNKTILSLIILTIASISDLRTKTVSNELWGIGIVFSVPLVALDFYYLRVFYILLWVNSMLITFLFCFILYYILKDFGGADLKCMIFLSILFPLGNSFLQFFLPFSLQILFLASILTMGWIELRNILKMNPKSRTVPLIPFILVSFVILLML